jgi:small-conductance mechanosensitive channel
MWVIVGTLLGGAALAFGLGARTAVGNIIGAHYVAQMYQVGQTVRVGEIEGRIVRTTAIAVVLDTPAGLVQVPARLFNEQPTTLISESKAT